MFDSRSHSPNGGIRVPQGGFSLPELMIAVTVASVISVGVITTFTSQSALFINQNSVADTAQEARDAHEMLMRLLQHANAGSIVITAVNGTSESLTADFTLPQGLPIWPNINGPDYVNHAIRVKWEGKGGTKYPYQLAVASAPNLASLSDDLLIPVAGFNSESSTRLTSVDLQKLPGNLIKISLVGEIGKSHERFSIGFDGTVLPRN